MTAQPISAEQATPGCYVAAYVPHGENQTLRWPGRVKAYDAEADEVIIAGYGRGPRRFPRDVVYLDPVWPLSHSCF